MRFLLAFAMFAGGCQFANEIEADVVSKDHGNRDDDRSRLVQTAHHIEQSAFYSGLSPHKLGNRSRVGHGESHNSFKAAPVTLEYSSFTRAGTWPVGRAATVELKGATSPTATYTWFSDGQIVGTGARVNIAAPTVPGPINVHACATDATDGTTCADATYTAVPALTTVELDPITTVATWSGGRWIRIAGRVNNMPATAPIIRLYVHTDVFYSVASATVSATGQFAATIHTANNVDRVAAVAMLPSYDWTKASGCTTNYCIGRRDALTGRWLPMPIDETNVLAFAVHYAGREIAMTAVEELKRRSMANNVNGAMQPARFIRSELDGDACFTYDQAVAAIALVSSGEQTAAEQVLNALVNVQRSDGSWYFAYRGNGSSDFPTAGDVRYMGAIAWVALAFNAYAQAYGITRYATAHSKVMDYLKNQMTDADGARAIRFNPSDLATTPWDERKQTAVEHTLDAYAAMIGYQRLLGTNAFDSEITSIETYVSKRWTGSDFTPGYMIDQGANTTELYLDTQSWTLLALGSNGTPYVSGLQTNCDQLFEPAGVVNGSAGVRGYFHFRWRTGTAAASPFVWSEGTAGMALAMQRYATTSQCRGRTASDLMSDLDSMVVRGGLPASTDNALSDFSESPATGGIGWYVFARLGINPFRPWEPRTPVP
jgi:hypothetical protein